MRIIKFTIGASHFTSSGAPYAKFRGASLADTFGLPPRDPKPNPNKAGRPFVVLVASSAIVVHASIVVRDQEQVQG